MRNIDEPAASPATAPSLGAAPKQTLWLENGPDPEHTRARRERHGRRSREEDRDDGDELRVPPLREPSLQGQGRPLVPINTEHEQEGLDREQCGLEQAERRDRPMALAHRWGARADTRASRP